MAYIVRRQMGLAQWRPEVECEHMDPLKSTKRRDRVWILGHKTYTRPKTKRMTKSKQPVIVNNIAHVILHIHYEAGLVLQAAHSLSLSGLH